VRAANQQVALNHLLGSESALIHTDQQDYLVRPASFSGWDVLARGTEFLKVYVLEAEKSVWIGLTLAGLV